MSIKIKLNINLNNKLLYYYSILKERLIKDKVVDMKDNYWIIDLNNGFVKVELIDKNKLIK